MADDFSFEIDTHELDDLLAQLPEKVAKENLTAALQASGEVMQDAIRTVTPMAQEMPTPDSNALPPGILREDIQVDVNPSKQSVHVGPTEIAGHVARWINNGWTLTTHGKKRWRKQIKDIPGKHFMEAGFDSGAEPALQAFIEKLREKLNEGK
jgi:hypothetical protein